jgi:hypothetical protein
LAVGVAPSKITGSDDKAAYLRLLRDTGDDGFAQVSAVSLNLPGGSPPPSPTPQTPTVPSPTGPSATPPSQAPTQPSDTSMPVGDSKTNVGLIVGVVIAVAVSLVLVGLVALFWMYKRDVPPLTTTKKGAKIHDDNMIVEERTFSGIEVGGRQEDISTLGDPTVFGAWEGQNYEADSSEPGTTTLGYEYAQAYGHHTKSEKSLVASQRFWFYAPYRFGAIFFERFRQIVKRNTL